MNLCGGKINLEVSVGPHEFDPIRWWDRFHQNGRCRGCYFPKHGHPIRNFFAVARPYGDTDYVSWDLAAKFQLEQERLCREGGE